MGKTILRAVQHLEKAAEHFSVKEKEEAASLDLHQSLRERYVASGRSAWPDIADMNQEYQGQLTVGGALGDRMKHVHELVGEG